MEEQNYQTTDFVVKLDCCGTTKTVSIKPVAILEGLLHECRRTVQCPACHKIVILQFSASITTTVVSEEVLGTDEN